MKKLKAVVIGCGKIGAKDELFEKMLRPATHAFAFDNYPGTELVGLADIDEKKLAAVGRNFPSVAKYHDYTEMLRVSRPDIVSIATPTNTHAEILESIVKFGPKAIICEKPIADNIVDAKKMVRLCQKKELLFFVNHSRSFDPTLASVKKIITDLGGAVQVNALYTRGIKNNGSHLMDLLRNYFGEVEEVSGFRNRLTEDWNDLLDDYNIDGILFFKSGSRAVIQSLNAKDYFVLDIQIYCRKGSIALTNSGFNIELRRAVQGHNAYGFKNLDCKPKNFGAKRSFMLPMVKHVAKCIKKNLKPLSTGADATLGMNVIESLIESANENGKIVKI